MISRSVKRLWEDVRNRWQTVVGLLRRHMVDVRLLRETRWAVCKLSGERSIAAETGEGLVDGC